MLAYLGNVEFMKVIVMLLIILMPFILVCWLLIEIIRWLRRK